MTRYTIKCRKTNNTVVVVSLLYYKQERQYYIISNIKWDYVLNLIDILESRDSVSRFYSEIESLSIILNYTPEKDMSYDRYIVRKLEEALISLCDDKLYYEKKGEHENV